MVAFYDKNNCFFVTYGNDDGGNSTLKLGSAEHKNHIIKEAIRSGDSVPGKSAIAAEIDQLRTDALVNEVENEVSVRVAAHDGGITIDLAGRKGLAVLIKPDSVNICTPPVPFLRPKGLKELPDPNLSGSLDRIAEFLPSLSEHQLMLLTVWLLAAMIPSGPYSILLLTGPKGTAKSTMAKLLRKILDPSTVPLQSMPRNERDLMITANNSRILVFDNLRQLRPEVSDCLCRISTGGGFKTRKLFANDEEVIFQACRPIILTGIHGIIGETDLLDRTLFMELPPISPEKRRTEKEILAAFTKAVPEIFGALCKALSKVLKLLPDVKTQHLPRMADFARIGIAVERALEWKMGSFLSIYEANRDLALTAVADNDPLAHTITKLVERTKAWQGTSSALLEALAPYRTRGITDWPLTPRSLSVKLRSLAGGLQGAGITIEFDINIGSQKRLIRIRWEDREPEPQPVNLSLPSIIPASETRSEHECSVKTPLDTREEISSTVNIRSFIVQ